MEYSSGVILYRTNDNNVKEFFVCTPDGPFWKHRELWNFPKGHIESGETPFEAAIREFKEETSVELNKNESFYDYLGLKKQNNKKNVHIFAKQYDNEDLSNCYSNLCATNYKGKKITHPEIKDYRWMTYDELSICGMKCYNDIFKKLSDD